MIDEDLRDLMLATLTYRADYFQHMPLGDWAEVRHDMVDALMKERQKRIGEKEPLEQQVARLEAANKSGSAFVKTIIGYHDLLKQAYRENKCTASDAEEHPNTCECKGAGFFASKMMSEAILYLAICGIGEALGGNFPSRQFKLVPIEEEE